MSQEFDIYRELWDYCDDQSRRIPFPESPVPKETAKESPDFLQQVDSLLDFLDEEETKKEIKAPPKEPPDLSDSVQIWNYMNKISAEKKTVCK